MGIRKLLIMIMLSRSQSHQIITKLLFPHHHPKFEKVHLPASTNLNLILPKLINKDFLKIEEKNFLTVKIIGKIGRSCKKKLEKLQKLDKNLALSRQNPSK